MLRFGCADDNNNNSNMHGITAGRTDQTRRRRRRRVQLGLNCITVRLAALAAPFFFISHSLRKRARFSRDFRAAFVDFFISAFVCWPKRCKAQQKLIKLKDNEVFMCVWVVFMAVQVQVLTEIRKPQIIFSALVFFFFFGPKQNADCQPNSCLHLSNCGFFIFINKSKSCLYKRHPKIMFDRKILAKLNLLFLLLLLFIYAVTGRTDQK